MELYWVHNLATQRCYGAWGITKRVLRLKTIIAWLWWEWQMGPHCWLNFACSWNGLLCFILEGLQALTLSCLAGSLTSLHFQGTLSAPPEASREPTAPAAYSAAWFACGWALTMGCLGLIHFPAVLLFELEFPAEVISCLSGIYLKKVWSLTRPV